MSEAAQHSSERSFQRPRWPPALAAALGLAVLAAIIAWSAFRLREQVRAQIANRDGEAFDAMAAMQYLDDKSSGETIAGLDDPGEQMQLVLKISRLRNVLGVRLFSPKGEFVNAVPAYITEASLRPEDFAQLSGNRAVSHFYPRARLEEQDLLAETNSAPVPLLEVNVPLREDEHAALAGVAQFLLNGSSIAEEYARLDRQLAFQSALAFIAGGSILAIGLAFAFRRVNRANRLLAERTNDLLKANRELTLAAKTSVVGALASHLIHGLKNPLSGLHNFVQDHAAANGHGENNDWQLAVQTTERMAAMINRVVRVLQEAESGIAYEVSLVALADTLTRRMQNVARAQAVEFRASAAASGAYSNRDAELILLILENLIQNAIEASPPGKGVELRIFAETPGIVMEVQDEGPGLPPDAAGRLFAPCTSSKASGSGIGLAISQQLARHLGATLELKASSPQGSIFRLILPLPRENASIAPFSKAEPRPPTIATKAA